MTDISATVIRDSIHEGARLTTMEVTHHLFILPEVLTHRQLSRNSSSSRAIPLHKRISQVEEDPAVPVHFGKNKPGMSADEEVDDITRRAAKYEWLRLRDEAVKTARKFECMGLHKQVASRILQPFLWNTILISATEWDNFFDLRLAPDAQPEIQEVARLMFAALKDSEPVKLQKHQWHTPYIQPHEEDFPSSVRLRLSVARCARVSYLTHGDASRGMEKDFGLFKRLVEHSHNSPLEQVAIPSTGDDFEANFRGWTQLRHKPRLLANLCKQ